MGKLELQLLAQELANVYADMNGYREEGLARQTSGGIRRWPAASRRRIAYRAVLLRRVCRPNWVALAFIMTWAIAGAVGSVDGSGRCRRSCGPHRVSPVNRPRPVAADERVHLAGAQGEVDAAPQWPRPRRPSGCPHLQRAGCSMRQREASRLSGATTGPQLRGSPRNRWALVESDQYDGHNPQRSGRTERPAVAQSTRYPPPDLIEVG
jgi:hypothetical protein